MSDTAHDETTRHGVDADSFAEAFRQADEGELATAMSGGYRDAVLAEIFRQMPSRLRADRAAGIRGALQWRIGGREDGGEDLYEVLFDDGACRVSRQETEPPRATMRLDAVAFLKLISQASEPSALLMERRLSVRGDVGFAMQSEALFRKPLDED